MNKRIIPLVLFILLLSACAGTPAETSGEQAPEVSAVSAEPSRIETKALLSEPYVRLLESGTFCMEYRMETDAEGSPVKIEGCVASGQGVLALISKASVSGAEPVESRVLMRDGKSYMIDDAGKLCVEMEGAEVESPVDSLFSLRYRDGGTDEIDGKSLSYEEYESGNGSVRFYFDGEKLHAIEAGEALMLVSVFSGEIPEGILEIPAGYVKIG